MKDYKIKTYIQRGLNYAPLQAINPSPEFLGVELQIAELTYEEVKGVMRELRKPTTWKTIGNIFETCYRITEDEFLEGRIVEFFAARNFILKSFTRLMETEKKLLTSLATLDSELWSQAGGDRLNRFGDTLPLNQLGKIYGIYPFELKDKKYQEILLLLTIEKEQREIQSKYDELRSKLKK